MLKNSAFESMKKKKKEKWIFSTSLGISIVICKFFSEKVFNENFFNSVYWLFCKVSKHLRVFYLNIKTIYCL